MSVVTLELPETLMETIKKEAAQAKVSVEQYIVFTLSRQSNTAYKVTPATPDEIREQELKFAALRQSLGNPNRNATKRVLQERGSIEPEKDLNPRAVEILQSKFKP